MSAAAIVAVRDADKDVKLDRILRWSPALSMYFPCSLDKCINSTMLASSKFLASKNPSTCTWVLLLLSKCRKLMTKMSNSISSCDDQLHSPCSSSCFLNVKVVRVGRWLSKCINFLHNGLIICTLQLWRPTHLPTVESSWTEAECTERAWWN